MATSMDVAEDAGNITIYNLVKAQGNVADEICLKLVKRGSLLLVQAVVLRGKELKVCQLEKDYAQGRANISRMNRFIGAIQTTEPDKERRIKVQVTRQDGGSMELQVTEVEPNSSRMLYKETLEPVLPLGPEVMATLSAALQKVRQQTLDLFAAQNKLSNLDFEYAKCKQLLDTRVKEKDQVTDELLSKFVSLLSAKKSEIIRLKMELGEGDDADVDDQDTDASIDNDVDGGTDTEDEGTVKTGERPKKKGKKVKHKGKGTIHMTMDDISSDVENEEETKEVHDAPRAKVFRRNDSDSEKDESAMSVFGSRREQGKSLSPQKYAPVSVSQYHQSRAVLEASSTTQSPRQAVIDQAKS